MRTALSPRAGERDPRMIAAARRSALRIGGAAMLATLAACSGWIATSGPSVREMAAAQAQPSIPLIDIEPHLAMRLAQAQRRESFADEFPGSPHGDYRL